MPTIFDYTSQHRAARIKGMGFPQYMQRVDYRIWTYLLAVPSFVFFTLSLVGCVSASAGIPGIFVAKLDNGDNKTSAFSEVRLGYFGICASISGRIICQSSAGKTSDALLQSLIATSYNNAIDTSRSTKMLDIALSLQSRVITCLLSAAGMLYTLGVFFLLILKRSFKIEAKRNERATRRRHNLRRICLTLLWLTTALTLASALSVNQATSAMEYVTRVDSASEIKINGGKTAK